MKLLTACLKVISQRLRKPQDLAPDQLDSQDQRSDHTPGRPPGTSTRNHSLTRENITGSHEKNASSIRSAGQDIIAEIVHHQLTQVTHPHLVSQQLLLYSSAIAVVNLRTLTFITLTHLNSAFSAHIGAIDSKKEHEYTLLSNVERSLRHFQLIYINTHPSKSITDLTALTCSFLS